MNEKINVEDLNKAKQELRMAEAQKRINEQIENLPVDDSIKEELKAILILASKDSLGRVNLSSDDKDIVERIGIIVSKENPRLALIKRFRDIETGRGEEGIEEISLEDIYHYIHTKEISMKHLAEYALRGTSEEQARNACNVERTNDKEEELNNDRF